MSEQLHNPPDRGHGTALKRTIGAILIVLLLLITLAILPQIGPVASTIIFWVGTVVIVFATRFR
jgi:hypothetical protein